MKTVRHLVLGAAALLVSCASDKGSPPPERKSLSQRVEESNGYTQDANGNWVPKSDKRSSFEAQGESPYFKGTYAGKEYKAGEYAKKSWWGNKDYQPKAYAGNTDGSRFMTKSRYDGSGAPESGTAAKIPDPYQTGTYATGAAREAGKGPIAKPSDAESDQRREVFPEPEIIDWREQRSLSIEQSKGILGR